MKIEFLKKWKHKSGIEFDPGKQLIVTNSLGEKLIADKTAKYISGDRSKSSTENN